MSNAEKKNQDVLFLAGETPEERRCRLAAEKEEVEAAEAAWKADHEAARRAYLVERITEALGCAVLAVMAYLLLIMGQIGWALMIAILAVCGLTAAYRLGMYGGKYGKRR